MNAMSDPTVIKTFLLAGSAELTLTSKKSGASFRYKVAKPREKSGPVTHFVSLLEDSDDDRGLYFGHLFEGGNFAHGKKARVHEGSPQALAFKFFYEKVVREGKRPEEVEMEVANDGLCGKCEQALMDLESSERGICYDCLAVKSQDMEEDL